MSSNSVFGVWNVSLDSSFVNGFGADSTINRSLSSGSPIFIDCLMASAMEIPVSAATLITSKSRSGGIASRLVFDFM